LLTIQEFTNKYMKYAILDENKNFVEFREFDVLPAHKPNRILPVNETFPEYDLEYFNAIQNIEVKDNSVEVTYTLVQRTDILDNVRSKRNELLKDSDWTQFNDSPLSNEKRQEWAVYRQNLRDLPNNWDNQIPIIFPIKPE